MSDPYGIDVAAARGRQTRLLEWLRGQQIDAAIVTLPEHVQWLAGPRFAWLFSPCAALEADGRLTLIAPHQPEAAAADEIALFEAKRFSTLRNDQRAAAAARLLEVVGGRQQRWSRVAVEFGSAGPQLTAGLTATLVDLEPTLLRLRRRKDADELAKLRRAIDATGAMYRRARQIVRPGANELAVFSELQAVAVEALGEMLTGAGNDYASGAKGGPPRDRRIEAGELYILDLGPAYRGYFADTCRTFAVGGAPTADQRRTWERILPVFDHVRRVVRPGKSCRELFAEAKAILDDPPRFDFDHHLGHGIGLFPHEGPHLNPNSAWNDVFEVGDVFTVEPGLYAPHLRAGIRLENDYRVMPDGVELLSDFPLEL